MFKIKRNYEKETLKLYKEFLILIKNYYKLFNILDDNQIKRLDFFIDIPIRFCYTKKKEVIEKPAWKSDTKNTKNVEKQYELYEEIMQLESKLGLIIKYDQFLKSEDREYLFSCLNSAKQHCVTMKIEIKKHLLYK